MGFCAYSLDIWYATEISNLSILVNLSAVLFSLSLQLENDLAFGPLQILSF